MWVWSFPNADHRHTHTRRWLDYDFNVTYVVLKIDCMMRPGCGLITSRYKWPRERSSAAILGPFTSWIPAFRFFHLTLEIDFTSSLIYFYTSYLLSKTQIYTYIPCLNLLSPVRTSHTETLHPPASSFGMGGCKLCRPPFFGRFN